MATWNYVVPQLPTTVFSETKYKKNSPIGSLHRLANLIIATVQVVFACGGLAARLEIFSITLESGLAQTLSSCADRIGSTLDSFAQVISALSHSRLLRETLLERVAAQAGLTATIVAAHSVDADSVLAAQASSAFIDIRASKEGNASEACQALTHLAAIAIRATFGVIPTAASILSIAVLWDGRLAALIGIS